VAYCDYTDVTARTGFDIGANTIPDTDQVTKLIDEVAAELDTVLAGQGATVPVTTPANAVIVLRKYNAIGAAAAIERTQYTQASPNESKRVNTWQAQYDKILEGLRSGATELLNSLLGTIQSDFPTDSDIEYPITDDQVF